MRCRIFLALGWVALTACVEPDEGLLPGRVTLGVEITPSGLRLWRESDGLSPESTRRPLRPALRYELRDRAGARIASGVVADPREVNVETFAPEGIERSRESRSSGAFLIEVPARRGELVVWEQTSDTERELGRALVDTDQLAVRGHGLAVLGRDDEPPVLLAGDPGASATEVIDLLFVGEGFTAEQLGSFRDYADAVIAGLRQNTDYGRWFDHFRFWRIDVRSRSSQLDRLGEDGFNRSNDTAFDCLAVPPQHPMATYLEMECHSREILGLIERLAAKVSADATIMIVNANIVDIGGPYVGLGQPFRNADVVAHELGHVLGGLGDEGGWDDHGCERWDPNDYVNVSVSAERSRLPWRDLVLDETPLPTVDEESDAIGAFRGALYCDRFFRPSARCTMNGAGPRFCAVCRREMERVLFGGSPPEDEGESPPREPAGPPPQEPEQRAAEEASTESCPSIEGYCTDWDDFCDEDPDCCPLDVDDHEAGPCNGPGSCPDYDYETHCLSADGYCDEDDDCCAYDSDNHGDWDCLE